MDAPPSPPATAADDPGPGSQRPPGYDVFISHSSKDKAAADAACHALEARDIRCWIAPRDIRPGANWGEAILEGISSVRVMALLLSNHANASPQIQREVERAVHRGVIVIPVRIEEVMPAKSLEYFLSTSHWLDAFRPPLNAHWQHLGDTVQGILGQEVVRPPAVVANDPPRGGRWLGLAVAGLLALVGAAIFFWWQAGRAVAPPSAPAQVSAGIPTPAPAAATPSPVAAASTPAVATPPPPPPEPPAPTLADFAGNWEISVVHLDDGAGNEAFYQPIRFAVGEDGQVTGKASLTMESHGGKMKVNQPPKVAALTGTVSAPQNKKHLAGGSALDANNFTYKVIHIEFKLADGVAGRGTLGLTDGLPVAEEVTLNRGEMIGRMYADKH